MSYEDVMNIVLPPQGDRSAHITGHYGEHRANRPHGGSDFNYQGGQAGINLTHPAVHAPVAGEVTFVGGQYGTIKIRDAQGNSHEILHTHTQSVVVGQQLVAGDEIATMGGRGPRGAAQYAQHVHYQMKNSRGHAVNPEQYWNQHPAQTPTAIAPSGTALKQGTHDPAVHALQADLATLGYVGVDGKPLNTDGHFGINTRHAVEIFQRDHRLEMDGIAGTKTLEAIHDAKAHAMPGLADPKHPDHAMYAQALAGVHRLDANLDRIPDRQSENLAASLVVAAKHEGMTRIDSIAFSEDGSRAFAVQDKPGSPIRQFAHVQTHDAVNASVAQSTVATAMVKPPQSVPTPYAHASQQAGAAISM